MGSQASERLSDFTLLHFSVTDLSAIFQTEEKDGGDKLKQENYEISYSIEIGFSG